MYLLRMFVGKSIVYFDRRRNSRKEIGIQIRKEKVGIRQKRYSIHKHQGD